jgi:hypothetical protein
LSCGKDDGLLFSAFTLGIGIYYGICDPPDFVHYNTNDTIPTPIAPRLQIQIPLFHTIDADDPVDCAVPVAAALSLGAASKSIVVARGGGNVLSGLPDRFLTRK